VISETISLSGSGNNGTYNSSNSYTVPTGKVWKIENIGFMTYTSNNTYGPRVFLILNGVQVLSNDSYSGNPSIYERGGNLIRQPFWFKGGDILNFGMLNNCATNCAQSANLVLSIIEFNIIP
jgi:hypothetical protein